MITRTMQVEERVETLNEVTFELRQKNPNQTPDDRFTLVVLGDSIPSWRPGQVVTVSVEVK